MTIYAIVNNLLPPTQERTRSEWTLISPAGILQGGNPYFVPDFADSFEARAVMAVRIGKLGKGIARRFASRYVEAVAPAVLFTAADLLQAITHKGLPWSRAISYDRCLAMGTFQRIPFDDIPGCECSIEIQSEDSIEKACRLRISDKSTLEGIIENISRENTLKTGDILLVEISPKGPRVEPGLKVTLKINGEDSLRFNIR